MPSKPSTISHICGVLPVRPDILVTPRRSYNELEQALQLAEQLTERTLAELLALQQQQQQAGYTDTPDKMQIQRQLQFMIKQGQRHNKSFALLFVEMDQYQQVLKQYGDTVAKQLIELTLARMAAVVRECDSISQQVDGQFLLLITDVTRIYDVVLVAEKLMQKLALVSGICPEPLRIEVSIGISRFPEDGNEGPLLVERAAAAMRHAQSRGGNQFSFLR